MTVKITLEFVNVDAAIVALGKLSKADGVTITPDGPRKERKGRNDKGKPRGAQPATQEAAAPATQERTDKAATLPSEATPAEAHKALPSGEVSPKAAASSDLISSAEDAQKALETLFNSAGNPETGIQKAKDALGKFGVTRIRDLPPEKRAEFIKEATAALPK